MMIIFEIFQTKVLTCLKKYVFQGQEVRDQVNIRERRNSFNTPGQNGGATTPTNTPEGQLKYENDRLKLALAQR